jgi:hypothetical protein
VAVVTALRHCIARRAAILTPSTFLPDWQHVCQRFGNFNASIVDGRRYRELQSRSSKTSNPLADLQILISAPYFMDNSQRLSDVLALDWDALVVDEASYLGTGEAAIRLMWQSNRFSKKIAVSEIPPPEWLEGNLVTVRWTTLK